MGIGIKQAEENLKNFSVIQINLIVDKKKWEQLKDKYENVSYTEMIREIINSKFPKTVSDLTY